MDRCLNLVELRLLGAQRAVCPCHEVGMRQIEAHQLCKERIVFPATCKQVCAVVRTVIGAHRHEYAFNGFAGL